jgi:hypothetical protein
MTERSYRDATRPDKLRRWHGILSAHADPGTAAETVYDEIGDALDHVSGWTPGVDQREQQAPAATQLAHRLSDLLFDHEPVQGTVDGPNPWFGAMIDGQWYTVTVVADDPTTPPVRTLADDGGTR